MAICETCDYANRPPYKSPCSECDKTMGSPFCCYEHEEKTTNADRIRVMTDEELAWFMAERNVDENTLLLLNKDHGLTAVQIEALRSNVYYSCMHWLKQPAE